MNLNYAIFRSEPIMNTNDLSQIGSHNRREKKAYQSNPDIDITKNKDNIELVPLAEKYLKEFDNLTKEYKKEHEIHLLNVFHVLFISVTINAPSSMKLLK